MSEAFSMIWMPWQPPHRLRRRTTLSMLYWGAMMHAGRDHDTRKKQLAWVKWRHRMPDHDWPVCVY